MKSLRITIGAGVFLLVLLIIPWITHYGSHRPADRLILLVPDGVNLTDPRVTVWLDAGSEEGLHVVPVHDSEFIRPLFPQAACAGVILPDSIHQRASDTLLSTIRRFVASGGKLMLVYDAGTLSLEGRYAAEKSRLSDLAGVEYAFYDRLQDKTIQWEPVKGDSGTFRQLGISPGKYYPFQIGADALSSSQRPKHSRQDKSEVQIRRYKYGDLQYPSFVTSGSYDGQAILHSNAGVVAGEHNYEKGAVLFVNLPLGYLKGNTDGLLLHVFLKYFAEHFLSLPYLMAVPDGVGGLILNWHVDSNAAIRPLQEMSSWSLLQHGPYSIHITAGPDTAAFGDKRGFDVEHNPVSQTLIRGYANLGYEIGSHGGWIHNYFSEHVDKDDPKELEPLLASNQSALEHLTGKPVVEYSAPNGNQPPWVTRWLETHGFVAYYFTGDTGMGPTQGYRGGVREGRNIWAFPIAHLDRAAGFEEMGAEGYSSSEIERWLEAVTEFTAENHSARLIYFHPPGILEYRAAVRRWLQQTSRLQAQEKFRWYTMAALANFLNSRKQVRWTLSEEGGLAKIRADHPDSLAHETWRLPASKFSEPALLQGSAEVIRSDDAWMVVAGPGRDLEFETRMVSK